MKDTPELKSINPKEETRGVFDWSLYEDGYNGKNLTVNKSVDTHGLNIKVYCHEHYAQEVLEKYVPALKNEIGAKDLVPGSVLSIIDVAPTRSTTSFMALTAGGGSVEIDMNKEREYLKLIFTQNVSPADFVDALKNSPDWKSSFLSSKPTVKIDKQGRPSLLGGKVEESKKELMEQLKNPTGYYEALVQGMNRGGYIVDIMGAKCFLPSSMASAGPITDPESLIGKRIPVMVINYVASQGFVVSYKKYLANVLPQKAKDELEVNKYINCTVTAVTKRAGAYVSFNDNEGNPIYSGMLITDECCDFLESQLESRSLVKGDKVFAYIHKITIEDDGTVKVILGDTKTTDEKYLRKQAYLFRERERLRKEALKQQAETKTEKEEKDA